ncbi:MAG: alpha/beta hydrolase [Rhodospirillales bacterium]|nr:alpha/beta hydrolase [Rhodospirillales bacterium]
MAVYRHFDQHALDAEYNLRARVPEHPEFFARWAAESAAVRRSLRCKLDVAYGRSDIERLDVFPAARKGAPVLVFIHGGYWRSLDKGDFSYLAPAYVEAGVTFVSVNYALAPNVRMDEIVRQARAAVAWVRAKARTLGCDPSAVFVAGHSAGGHLATMAATPNPVQGVCSVSGLYDLEPVRHAFVNEDLGLDEATAHRNSPQHLAPPANTPVVLAIGSEETAEFKRHQAEFAAIWRVARSLEIPGRHHYSVIDAFGDRDHGLFGTVLDMIDGRLD